MANTKTEWHLLKHDIRYRRAYIQVFIIVPLMAIPIALLLMNIIKSTNFFVYACAWACALVLIYAIDHEHIYKNIQYIQRAEKRVKYRKFL